MPTLRAFLIFLAFPILTHAATLELTDGRIYSGEILSQDNERLTLSIQNMQVQLPRSSIVWIDESGTPPAPLKEGEIQLLPVTDSPPRVAGAAPPAGIPERTAPKPPMVIVPASHEEVAPRVRLEVRLPLPEDPLLLLRFHAVIDSLRDDLALPGARRVLNDAGDAGLAVLAGYGLYHESPLVRTRSAGLLADMGGPRVLKYLIEAFHAAARPTVEPFQVGYMEALMRGVSRVTGVEFYAYLRRASAAPGLALRMVQWWQQHYAELPPQLGEPPLDSKSPDYAAQLAEVRSLVLRKRDFAGFNYPPDWVAPAPPPGMVGAYPLPPTIPRSLELERNVSGSQEPASEKSINTARDEPGLRRQAEYMDKVREAIRAGTYR